MTASKMLDTLHCADVSSSEASADDLCHIVNSFNTNKAQYENGKIMLMADTSKFLMSILALGSIGGLGAGALCLLSAGLTTGLTSRRSDDAMNKIFWGAGLAALGAYSTYKLVRYMAKRMSTTPYLTLDATGILEWDKRVLTWDKLYSIQFHTEFINRSPISSLLLLVKEGDTISTALEISDDVDNDFLPIHQGQFVRLCGEVAKTQHVDLVSEPIVEQKSGIMIWYVKQAILECN
jgi:hypothetical protein